MRHVFVTRVLTHHMYRFSPYETSDHCGNCDGGGCEYCKERWAVEDWDTDEVKLFDTEEEAKAYAKELESKDIKEV